VYTLHIANKNYSSWSLRPWLVLKTLDIPFTEIIHPFGQPGAMEFASFSPTGRVPCLEADGMLVWDSLAIVEYLAERHAGVWPLSTVARAWARSASAEMHSDFQALRNACAMSCGVRVRLNAHTPALDRDIERIASLWLDGINRFGGPFLAGSTFTAVDAFFGPVAFRALSYGLDFGEVGNRYVDMLRKQPAMRDWYDAGLAETWREQGHEDEVQAAGEIVEDLRATSR